MVRDEASLQRLLEVEGIPERYYGPTTAECVDDSLTGKALSRCVAKAKAARSKRHTHLLQCGRDARKKNLRLNAAATSEPAVSERAAEPAASEPADSERAAEPAASEPAATLRVLRAAKPVEYRDKAYLSAKTQSIRVSRGHQAKLPLPLERSLERGDELVIINRERDLRRDRGGKRKGAYRGFFVHDQNGNPTAELDVNEDGPWVGTGSEVEGKGQWITTAPVRSSLRAARAAALRTGASAGGGGGEAAKSRAAVMAEHAPEEALGSAQLLRPRGVFSPLVVAVWANGEDLV